MALMRPAPLFRKVVIAGVGLIGGSIGLGVRQRFLAETVIGLDPDPEALDAAQWTGVIDETHLEAGDWLRDADLVILAAPVQSLIELARSMEPWLSDDAIVTDVGGVKQELVEQLSHLRFVGGHPMAGSERNGVVNADAALLENAVWVLTPVAATDPEAFAKVQEFVTQLGARPLTVEPEQHDRLVAAVSHVPYLTSLALTQLVAGDTDRDLMMLLAAGGFRDATRVAASDTDLWLDICASNREAIVAVLDDYRADIARRNDRGEGDEQRVIALAPGQILVFPHTGGALAHGDTPHLGGSGLAAHRHARHLDPRAIGRAPRIVGDLIHRPVNQVQFLRSNVERGKRG